MLPINKIIFHLITVQKLIFNDHKRFFNEIIRMRRSNNTWSYLVGKKLNIRT